MLSARRRSLIRIAGAVLALVGPSAVLSAVRATDDAGVAAAGKPAHPLVWDAMEKTLNPKLGEQSSAFQFTVTNTSNEAVTIEQIRPTCGCTVAEMPSSPWILKPHETGSFVGTIDFRGKEGTLTKALFVNSSAGTQMLGVTVRIPVMDEAMRKKNQMAAQADRQASFHGDCAGCHAQPAIGRSGGELFSAACGVCHLATNRASMVPDLLTAKERRDAAYWRKWITEGKAGTLMPAWSKEQGGPLSAEQIESLVQFALDALPTEPSAPGK